MIREIDLQALKSRGPLRSMPFTREEHAFLTWCLNQRMEGGINSNYKEALVPFGTRMYVAQLRLMCGAYEHVPDRAWHDCPFTNEQFRLNTYQKAREERRKF